MVGGVIALALNAAFVLSHWKFFEQHGTSNLDSDPFFHFNLFLSILLNHVIFSITLEVHVSPV